MTTDKPAKQNTGVPVFMEADILWARDAEGNSISEMMHMIPSDIPKIFGRNLGQWQNLFLKKTAKGFLTAFDVTSADKDIKLDDIEGIRFVLSNEYFERNIKFMVNFSYEPKDEFTAIDMYKSLSHFPMFGSDEDMHIMNSLMFQIKLTPEAVKRGIVPARLDLARTQRSIDNNLKTLNEITGAVWSKITEASPPSDNYILNLEPRDKTQLQALFSLQKKLEPALVNKISEIAKETVPGFGEQRGHLDHIMGGVDLSVSIDYHERGLALVVSSQIIENKDFMKALERECSINSGVLSKMLKSAANFQAMTRGDNKFRQ